MADAPPKVAGNPTGMIILIVLMILIIYFIGSLPLSEQRKLIDIPGETRELVNTNPGSLPVSKIRSYKHELPIVNLNNLPKKNDVLLYSKVDIKERWLYNDYAMSQFNLPEGFVNAKLTFFVVDGDDAKLKVIVNKQVVHQEQLSSTKQAIISIPTNILKAQGNVIKIKIDPAGLKFWKSYTYTLSDVKLGMYTMTEAKNSATQKLSLSSDEVSGLQAATLTALVKQVSPEPAKLAVKVNEQDVFASNTGKSQTLDIGLPKSVLRSGINDITWEIDGMAKYQVSFGKLTTFSINKPAKIYDFYIYSGDEERLAASLMSCEILMQRESGGDDVTVQINDQLLTYKFDDDEVVDGAICPYLRGKANRVSLFAGEDISLSKLQVTMKVK